MSVLFKSQDADLNLLGLPPQSSPSRSISSTQSPQNWYHRTFNRFISQPGSPHQPIGLQGTAPTKKLSRKTSLSFLNATFKDRHLFSTQQEESGQRNESLVQLPGTPGGHSCRPLSLVVYERTTSSLDLLTPDQSGLSSDSGGPITPRATQSVYQLPLYNKELPGQVMGGSDSKVAGTNVTKILRKPVTGLLKIKKGQQSDADSDLSTSTPDPQPTSAAGSEPAPATSAEVAPAPTTATTAEVKKLVKEFSDGAGPFPDLHHRASSGKLKVPRRRSSLTAIHLNQTHFEKPLSSKRSGSVNRGKRGTSFSESFQPVVNISGSTTAVPSPNPQEGDWSGDLQSPDLFSPPLSNRRPSDLVSSSSQARSTQIRFPETFPDGDPILKPAPLMISHYACSRSHKLMRRERAIFNQVPCMTCEIDDKLTRFTCTWCELRVCESCMRQLSSRPRRPLEPLVKWAANRARANLRHEAETSSQKGKEKETIKRQQSTEALAGPEIRTRAASIAQSSDTVRESKRADQPKPKEDPMQNAADASKDAGKENQGRVRSASSVKGREKTKR